MIWNLRETVDYMIDSDYKMRFVAEYWQTKIRYEKLKDFCNKIEAADEWNPNGPIVTAPQHDCPVGMLRDQQKAMGEYLHVLEVRAVIEGVNLELPWRSEDK